MKETTHRRNTLTSRIGQTFQSLHHRNYRLYWFGILLSQTGRWMEITAQQWLVYQLTGSALLLGIVGFVRSLPMLIFSPLGGVIADRFDKRKVMLVTQPLAMMLTLTMATLVSTGVVRVWNVLLLAGLAGVVMAFDMPTQQALVPSMVPREGIPNAVALYSTVFHGTRIWGPTIAGVLIAPLGMGGVFYVATAGYASIIIALLLMKVSARGRAERRLSVQRDLVDGFRYMRGMPVALIVITLAAIFSLFGTAQRSLTPIFAGDVLKVGEQGLGWLMGASGVGALIGALWMASLTDFRHKGWLLLISSFMRGASLVWFALSKSFPVSVVALVFAGFTEAVNMTVMNTMLQLMSSNEMRGRVMSAYALTSSGLTPVAALVGGALAQQYGAPFAIALGGSVCAVAALVVTARASSLRRYQ